MTLAPGQCATGRFEVPGGGTGFVQFQRGEPRPGEGPFRGATVWTGDGKVTLAFAGDGKARFPALSEGRGSAEAPLGYASAWIHEGRTCRVVVRNVDDRPATFGWTLTGPANLVADWDLSGAGSGD